MQIVGDFRDCLRRCFIAVVFVFVAMGISADEKRQPVIGEKLVYDVYWKFIKVGYGTLETRDIVCYNGRQVYQFYSEAKSSSFFDTFFKVRDTNTSLVDVEKFNSIVFEQHISEGGYKREKRTDYDQQKHLATNNKGETFEVPENVLDVFASLYRVRLEEIKPGDNLTVNVNAGKKNYFMNVKVHKKEKIKINDKKYKTILIEPDLHGAGIFMSKGKVLIWMSDDECHIPIKMESAIAVGSIVAEIR